MTSHGKLPEQNIIDSEVACMLLGVTQIHLRQLVHRGQIKSVGKKGRRSTFYLQEVLELQEKRKGV